jgi:hypothetical protein
MVMDLREPDEIYKRFHRKNCVCVCVYFKYSLCVCIESWIPLWPIDPGLRRTPALKNVAANCSQKWQKIG